MTLSDYDAIVILSFCHISIIHIREKLSSILGNDNYKAKILSVIKNLESLALGIVQIFAQIGGDFLYPNYKILGGKEKDLT